MKYIILPFFLTLVGFSFSQNNTVVKINENESIRVEFSDKFGGYDSILKARKNIEIEYLIYVSVDSIKQTVLYISANDKSNGNSIDLKDLDKLKLELFFNEANIDVHRSVRLPYKSIFRVSR